MSRYINWVSNDTFCRRERLHIDSSDLTHYYSQPERDHEQNDNDTSDQSEFSPDSGQAP